MPACNRHGPNWRSCRATLTRRRRRNYCSVLTILEWSESSERRTWTLLWNGAPRNNSHHKCSNILTLKGMLQTIYRGLRSGEMMPLLA